jgi:flagellar hook-basal body complex protein FliE
VNEIHQFQIDPGSLASGAPAAAERAPAAGTPSFTQELGRAVEAVDRLQLDADRQADAVAHGAGNLHEVALSLEKADVAMRLASKVRNKLVDAYNDIMKMSV